MRLGLMGGTFDPVHLGHLVIAEEARSRFALDRVIWVPAGDPPHKKDRTITAQEHRFAMVLLATAANPYFDASRLELDRRGASYTIDTLSHFQAEFPEAELFFITGADTVLEFLTWHRHADVIRSAHFIAAARPGFDLARIAEALPPDYVPHITSLGAPALDISGTQIRERVRTGRTVRYLVPAEVEAYLRKHRLYE